MESAADNVVVPFLNGENGRFRVIACRAAVAPTIKADLVRKSLLLISPTSLSKLSAIFLLLISDYEFYYEFYVKLGQILLTNDKSNCTLT